MSNRIIISEHAEIIDVLGGCSVIAPMLNVSRPAVSRWKTNGIPFARRAEIKRRLADLGFDVPDDFFESKGGRRHVRR